MCPSEKLRFLALTLMLSAITAIPLSALQLGGLPAEEWAIRLESQERLDRLAIEEVVATIELQTGDIVADIGAGTGVFSAPMAQAVGPDGVVLAQDVDAGFLPLIAENAQRFGVPNVHPVLGEFEDPKLPRRDVDVAFICHTLHHIQGRGAFIQALAAYMAPGSRIVVVDYDMNAEGVGHQDEPELLISPEQVAGWMSSAGFEVSREHDLFENMVFVEYTKAD